MQKLENAVKSCGVIGVTIVVSRPLPERRSIRFGDDFELDVRAFQLRSGGILLKLKPHALELLLLLVERPGDLVTREEIVERIWGTGVFLDTDNSINGAISRIRQVLRDDAGKPRFIETVPGKGYRFVAPVTEVQPPAIVRTFPRPTVVAPAAPQSGVRESVEIKGAVAAEASPAAQRSFSYKLVVGFAVVAVAAGLVVYSPWTRATHRSPVPGRVMLAVLPFENLTGDAGQEYFSDGLTEEMITQLGRLDPEHLGVIARTSVMHYKDSHERLSQIGAALGVQYILEGSVRRDSEKVRITAQLIQLTDQTHLWAQEYDRELGGLLTLQGEIATEISEQIKIAIGNKSQRPNVRTEARAVPYEAYDLYLQGLYFWNRRNKEGFQRAIVAFQQAVSQYENYAQAYAGLADAYALMSTYGIAPPNEYMPKARAAALRALQIDDSLAEAHTALAVIAENYDWDWQTAEREYRRAIELNPNYATAHHWYAECLALEGRFDEALQESERARQLDPLSLIIAADEGAIFYFSRQYDRAIERFGSVLAMDPTFARAHLIIPAYVQKGQFQDAFADAEAWHRAAGDAPWIASWQAFAYGRSGDYRNAQEAMQRALELNREWNLDMTQFIIVCYSGLGDKEKLMALLERATRDRTNVPTGFKVDPIYDPLRSDARFQDLLQRAGLAGR